MVPEIETHTYIQTPSSVHRTTVWSLTYSVKAVKFKTSLKVEYCLAITVNIYMTNYFALNQLKN